MLKMPSSTDDEFIVTRTLLEQCLVLAVWLLVLISPIAMTFTPNAEIYKVGPHKLQHEQEKLYWSRALIIGSGLILASLSVTVASAITISRSTRSRKFLCLEMAMSAFGIGWVSYPYWVNGVFQAYCGAVPEWDFDPKGLMPMTWIGDLWRLPVLLYRLSFVLLGPALLGASIESVRHRATRSTGLLGLLHLAFNVALVLVSPRYMYWLMD